MLITYPYVHHKCNIHTDIQIAYMDEGSGDQTLLFLHGLGNYAPVWKHQLAGLKHQYRCIAIDMPGNGYSSRGDYPYTLFFYAESVALFIEKMELKNVVLCGHSMGGQIALIIALRYPHIATKLVLIAPAGFEYFSSHEVMMMQSMLSMGNLFYADEFHLESAIRQSFYSAQNESDSIISELKIIMNAHTMKQWRDMSLAGVKAMLNEQVQQYLPNITIPVHTIFGDKDAMIPNTLVHFGETPESIAKKATALIPHATYKMIKQAGHFVQIEKAAEVNAEIEQFLQTPMRQKG